MPVWLQDKSLPMLGGIENGLKVLTHAGLNSFHQAASGPADLLRTPKTAHTGVVTHVFLMAREAWPLGVWLLLGLCSLCLLPQLHGLLDLGFRDPSHSRPFPWRGPPLDLLIT